MASAAAAITLAVALAPLGGVAEPGLALRIVVETVAAFTALLAAALLVQVTRPPAAWHRGTTRWSASVRRVAGRPRAATPRFVRRSAPFGGRATWRRAAKRSGARRDRGWIALALVVLAAGDLAVVGLLVATPSSPLRAPIAAGAGLCAAILLATAAWPRLRPAPAAVACVVLAGSALALPGPAVHFLAAAALAAAAAGFDRRGTPWLAVAVTLGAFAQVNYALVEPAVADGFALISHVALLLIALRWFVHDAVRAERRRIARDLHDGVTQELVYIQRRAPHLAESDLGREIAAAAERALADARGAIGRLGSGAGERLGGPPAQPLGRGGRLPAEPLEAVAERCDVALELRGHPLRPELELIAAEAIRNAANHGRARTVQVHMTGGRLRISDDGVGFEPERATRGFGLTSMRERAEALGGTFRVRSRPGQGAEIEVELP